MSIYSIGYHVCKTENLDINRRPAFVLDIREPETPCKRMRRLDITRLARRKPSRVNIHLIYIITMSSAIASSSHPPSYNVHVVPIIQCSSLFVLALDPVLPRDVRVPNVYRESSSFNDRFPRDSYTSTARPV